MNNLARSATALVTGAIAALSLAVPVVAQSGGTRINVYTTREKDLIEPLLRVFEGLSRIKVEVVYLTGDASAKLADDARQGKVDLFVAAEFSQLIAAKAAGITEPVTNQDLVGRVPAAYRDSEGHWFGLTRRLRIVAPSRDRVQQRAFTYEELSDPKWKGKLCMRSGLHPYNAGLVASMIAHKGAEMTETWLRGLKANLSGKPSGGDRDQMAAVQAGRCDVAVVNTYYVGALRSAKDNPALTAAGQAVEIVFPNVGDRGAHVSVSGMSLIKDAPGINGAALLMDFLTSEPAQFIYALENFEYPIREDVRPSGLLESWGSPKLDELPLGEIAAQLPKAVDLIRKVGFDQGPGS